MHTGGTASVLEAANLVGFSNVNLTITYHNAQPYNLYSGRGGGVDLDLGVFQGAADIGESQTAVKTGSSTEITSLENAIVNAADENLSGFLELEEASSNKDELEDPGGSGTTNRTWPFFVPCPLGMGAAEI